VNRWLRHWARTVRPGVADPLGHLAFVIRWERGEIGGLPHLPYFDFTISGAIDPSEYVLAMVNTWKHGIAQVRLYDPYTPGVSRYLSRTNSRQRSSSRKSDSLSKSHGSGSFSGGRLSGWFILRTAF
jgi:hypothetical protein